MRKLLVKTLNTGEVSSLPAAPVGYSYLISNNGIITTKDNDSTDAVDRNTTPNIYTVYAASLTQAGTSKPTATLLQNTIGGTPSWEYSDVGQYTINITGAFPDITKISVMYGANGGGSDVSLKWVLGSSSSMKIYTWNVSAGAEQNDLLSNMTIEIKVYA